MLENFQLIDFLSSAAGLQVVAGFIVAGIITAGLNAVSSAYFKAFLQSEGSERARLKNLAFNFQVAAVFFNCILSFLLWGTPFAMGLFVFAFCYGMYESLFG